MQEKSYRPFQISCGLREGYDQSSAVHSIENARSIIQAWLEKRMKEDKKIAVGMILEGEFVYPWVENEVVSSSYEPAFHYKGMIREDASDEEVREMLEDLAKALAQKLQQKRVHIVFGSSYFLLESNS